MKITTTLKLNEEERAALVLILEVCFEYMNKVYESNRTSPGLDVVSFRGATAKQSEDAYRLAEMLHDKL